MKIEEFFKGDSMSIFYFYGRRPSFDIEIYSNHVDTLTPPPENCQLFVVHHNDLIEGDGSIYLFCTI